MEDILLSADKCRTSVRYLREKKKSWKKEIKRSFEILNERL